MAEGGPSSRELEAQVNEISNLLKKSLEKGDVRYLIDNRWFRQWKKYVGYENCNKSTAGEQSSHPGPIDNTPLFKVNQPGEIRDHLIEDLDYVFLPKEAWNMLLSIYGIMEGQEPIIRNIVEHGLYVKLCQVEVYQLDFKLCECTDLDNGFNKSFSKVDAVESIEKEMRKFFNIPDEKETRLWNCYTNCTYEQITRKDTSIQDAGLYTGQVIIIEQQNEDGTWPWPVKSSGYNYSSNENKTVYSSSGSSSVVSTRYGSMGGYGSYNYNYNESGTGDVQPGLCGLSNLGNTCFMNSALQCMSNTPPITRFFLDDLYWDQLNTENPLGMKGEIAKSYGELVKIMWSGKYTCTAPRPFKMQVGRFAPRFSGYQQQDSQELLAFLLDGLHEDLNRIKKKPYIELRDTNGRPDEVVAKEAWENYRKRNDSIIVDLFHGLLKSTLVCPEPECGKVSVTFDPFCYLTLPLPIKKERQIDVLFVPRDSASPLTQYKLTVPKAGNVSDLCAALSRFVEVPANKMIVTDVYNHKFHKIFMPDEALSIILERDSIYIYEVSVTSMDDPETVVLPVYMRQNRVLPGCSNDSRSGYHLFGQPILVDVPRQKCTCETLYGIILKQMARYVEVPSLDNKWWIKKNDDNMVNGVTMLNGDDEEESDSQADEENKDEDEGIDSQEELEYNNGDDKHHHMFTMHFVNSSGSTDVEKIKDDGQYIKFSNMPYLSIDWHPKAKELFFDEKLASSLEQHETASNCNRILQKRPVIQLTECLELFTAMERLSAEDSWHCPGCKQHQQATKKFDLWLLPQVLVLCFKRFSYNRYMRDKLDTLVEFPTKGLNMAKYIINGAHGPAIYDLIAVSNHYGGMGGGHYTAYCKNKDDQKWYYFDDNSVSPTKEEAVVSKAAYVLLYTLRDPRSSESMQPMAREIPAALGTPNVDAKETQDNGIGTGTSSDEDCSMDTN